MLNLLTDDTIQFLWKLGYGIRTLKVRIVIYSLAMSVLFKDRNKFESIYALQN